MMSMTRPIPAPAARPVAPARWRAIVLAVLVTLAVLLASAAAPQRAWAQMPEDVRDKWVDGVNFTEDSGGVYHVKTTKGWYHFAQASRDYDFDDATVLLDNDLDFSGLGGDGADSWAAITGKDDANAFTVGDDDMPFSGTFNGRGYTISNFDNHRDGLALQVDCGFFGQTRGATIKNTNFERCYVGATYRGGLVAGYAQDTFFLNVTCTNCMASIIPPNNVLNLITNAGMSGGMICGEANGSTLYNCEVAGGTVVNNATSGVGALGGQPLYLGGLVGWCNDTVIEYSRVTDIRDEDDKLTHTSVENKYGTAVSVASYSEVFTGGIVGGMKSEDSGSKIVDCYCTADVYSEAAIYFAVGLGLGVTRGYTGGIVGIVQDGGDVPNLIQRVSYAGNLHSYNYNILLLGIPIIEYDKYMGGITGRGGDNATIDQAYFMRNENGFGMGSSTDEDIYAVKTTYNGGYSDGAAYGPRDDSYTSRDFWESCGFDFAGGMLRNVTYPYTPDTSDDDWNVSHYNKWVMDYTRGIPVHGGSIKATLDFPGSGTVTIGQTGLAPEDSEQSTSDPYDFAVQGYEQGDESIDLTYEFTTGENESWAADERNQGFRFMGWYRSRDVRVNDIVEDHSQFTQPNSTLNTADEGLLSGEKYRVSVDESNDGKPDTLTVFKPGDERNPGNNEYSDNDLYVAYAQAQVRLHDVGGGLVNTSGEGNGDTNDDWYDYGAAFTLPTRVAVDSNVTGTFIGWTTVANMESGSDVGYTSVDPATLANLRAQGAFYEPGATFTVTGPANLYPVYSEYNNVSVIYEGHGEDLATRADYGTAVKSTLDGNLVLSVQPAENSPLTNRTVRFLGWYQYVGSATTLEGADADTAATSWRRVSRGAETKNPTAGVDCFAFNASETSADLTDDLIYKARFEYLVDYQAYHIGEEHYTQYAQVWEPYEANFEVLDGPDFYEHYFDHWARNDSFSPEHEAGPRDCTSCEAQMSADDTVTEPMTVVAHYEKDDDGEDHVVVTTDFPTGPQTSVGWTGTLGLYHMHAIIDQARLIDSDSPSEGITGSGSPDYWFHGWTFDSITFDLITNESESDRYTTNLSTDFDLGHTGALNNEGWAEAHITAEVNFHGVPSGSPWTVGRAYKERVFLDEDAYRKYDYHYAANKGKDHDDDATVQSTSQASPADAQMTRPGYVFLGWIDMTDPALGEDELDAILTNLDNSEAYVALSREAVAPYLMTGDEKCTRPMDLYPVYAGFSLETTTNIAQAGVDTSLFAVPLDPSLADGKVEGGSQQVIVGYNNDGGFVLGESANVKLSYNNSFEAAVTVSVDTATAVWRDAPEDAGNPTYTFQSLQVYKDGALEQTVLANTFEQNEGLATSSGAIVVEAGHAYEFVAVYGPVPVAVTYHLSDTETDVHLAQVGDLLPRPDGEPSFSNYEDQFAVGWVAGNAYGSPVDYASDTDMLTPDVDRVTGTMHLWPVYRSSTVMVNSNIDDAHTDPDDFRYTEKRGDNLVLVAEEVSGYDFVGWYTDYIIDENKGTEVSANTEHVLSGDVRFPDPSVTYTAVYQQAYEVRYHDTNGDVIYTARVTDDERTFVTTQEVVITNPDGSTSTVMQTVPIDTEAFAAIAEHLDTKNNADGATAYEQFVTWQWVDTGTSSPERWGNTDDVSSFINEPVSKNAETDGVMNLYPITMTFAATDSDNQPYTNMVPQLTLSEDGTGLASASLTLRSSYTQPWMKVHIDEVAYAPGSSGGVDAVKAPQEGVTVSLYTPGSSMGSPVATDITRSDDETVDGIQLAPGDALFTFTGRIVITKQTDDPNAAGKTFTFTVVDAGSNARTVSVRVGADPVDGTYTGTATIAVPFGSYTVTEDSSWAWRYDAKTETWALDANDGVAGNQPGWKDGDSVTVQFDSVISQGNPDGVTSQVRTTNTLKEDLGTKWFDGENSAHNVFGTRKDGE